MISNLNPRPKKRLKMPDLTWHDLPLEVKEQIVLVAPKELRSLCLLVCWEWYNLVRPHCIKFPSKQKWGEYHTKHYQISVANWAVRTENVDLLEWLVLKQYVLPPKDLKIHSAWLVLAARETRYTLIHHLMDTWTWGSYCHEVAMIAMRSGNMRLLILSLGKEMTLSEFGEYIKNKKMSHAAFADMDNNDEMIEFCHPIDCEIREYQKPGIHGIEKILKMKRDCLRYQIKEIVKVDHFEPFAFVEPILRLEKYRYVKNKYKMVFDFYARYGSIKGMISVLNKYGRLDELRSILMESTWWAAIKGGDLYILEYMLNAYLATKPTDCCVHKLIHRHDYKVLEWLVDNDIFHPDETDMIYAMTVLSDDPELIPMLSWLMGKYVLNQKVTIKTDGIDKIFITEAAIKTNRLEVIHWIYKRGLLWTMGSQNWLPKNIRKVIKQSGVNGCYHLLRVLHNLKVCDLSYTRVSAESMKMYYYNDARAMEKRPLRYIKSPKVVKGLLSDYLTFKFIPSGLGRLNPPPSF